ncbi:MAG: hypothetical protein ABII82_09770 [Verrucomicrobiota bacterium]
MKPQSALACFFAAYGIYTIINASYHVAGLIYAVCLGDLYPSHQPLAQIFQASIALLPLVIGVFSVWKARWLGSLVAGLAGLGPDERWSLGVSARDLCAVLLCVVGALVIVVASSALIQTGVFYFIAQAGDHQVGFAASNRLGSSHATIANIAQLVGGIILVKTSRGISKGLGF